MNNFTISDEDQVKIDYWLKHTVFPTIVLNQIGTDLEQYHVTLEDGTIYPYSGAIDGSLTYSFTPTSLGLIVKVSSHGYELDLTNYHEW